jgi:hypothetical protein
MFSLRFGLDSYILKVSRSKANLDEGVKRNQFAESFNLIYV